MNYKRIVLGGVIIGFFSLFVINNTFAQDNLLCSTTQRGQLVISGIDSYKTLYGITDAFLIKYINKNYDSFDLNKTISGQTRWYDNKKGLCDNLGTFVGGAYNLETTNWNTFRSKYGSIAGVMNGTELSISTVTAMQNYIKDHCGFNMGIDGQLGKKTINSVNICKPPALGYMLWSDFKGSYTKFYNDEEGKRILYTGDIFKEDPTQKLFIRKADIGGLKLSPGLGLVKEVFTGVCAEKFGFFYSQVVNDVKLEGKQCCYYGNKDGKTAGVTSPNASQWSINGTNATYTPPINSSTPTLLSTGGPITLPVCGITTNTNTATTCRFTPPTDASELIKYNAAKSKLGGDAVPTDCKKGCEAGYTEIKAGGASLCEKCNKDTCNCGIKLNTNIPFIGRCIMNEKTNNVGQNGNTTTVNTLNAFPILMGALIKLLMSIIMIVCFASLIVGGFMMTVPDQYDTGKGIVKKVIRTIVSLGSLGTILYLINPNFFS